MKNNEYHESVMTQEVLKFLDIRQAQSRHIKKQAKYIDATVGTGGHSLEIVKAGGIVLGIDMDPKMLDIARNRLLEACPGFEKDECFKLQEGNFLNIDKIAESAGFNPARGIVLDLGVSNLHLTDSERGFSFRNRESLLDMRLNPQSQGVKGSDLINLLREDQLKEMFSVTLPYSVSGGLAEEVARQRRLKPIETVGDFLHLLEGVKGKKDLHYATLPMLALRIAVNTELDNLKDVLPKAFSLLDKGGRLVVISFHSREDEIVKSFFKSKKGVGKALTENYIAPSLLEIEKNPRSRSARMRVLERLNEN